MKLNYVVELSEDLVKPSTECRQEIKASSFFPPSSHVAFDISSILTIEQKVTFYDYGPVCLLG